MLKSIGRSSHFWAKNCWRHCLPAASAPQDYFAALCQHGDGGRRGFGWPGDASCALTFQPSNHSFIQVFEMQPPHFTLIAQGHDMPSDHTRAAILNSAELFVTRSLATNRERLNELKAAEEKGGGRASIDAILRALVGPTLRGCLGPERERSTAARFMIRASIESVPPIRRIKNREIDHLRKFAAAMRRALPDRDEVDLYWGLHFALAMSHQTIRDSERLIRLSEGKCDLNDVAGIIERIVAVSVMALTGGESKIADKLSVQRARQ